MIKREVFQIVVLTAFLAIFFYQGVQRDFPVQYLIILVVCYVAVIAYRLIKVVRYKKEQSTVK